MKNDCEHTAPTSDSESAPALLTAEQARKLLKGIITEAMEGAKLLDEEGGAYSVKELGCYLQESIMQLVEELGSNESERLRLLLDYSRGCHEASGKLLQEHPVYEGERAAQEHLKRKTLH